MLNKGIIKIGLGPKRAKTGQKSPLLLILVSVVIVVLLSLGAYIFFRQVNNVAFKDVLIGKESFHLKVADTDAARIKGLSDRASLPQNQGMLFDFKTLGDWRIWMIDMHFNLDILWLNDSGKIVYIKQNARPDSYPEVFHANTPSRYVIELPAGTTGNLGIKVNDSIDLQ
jgi:uncharacterized protein